MRIALLALPGSMRSALAGLGDMFWLANQVIRQNPSVNADISRLAPFFDVRIVTADGKPVTDVQGRKIDSDCSFDESGSVDLIIASGIQLDEQKNPIAGGGLHCGRVAEGKISARKPHCRGMRRWVCAWGSRFVGWAGLHHNLVVISLIQIALSAGEARVGKSAG